jgi:uncharacterized repeat protein (TIGR01451 family)
MFVPREPKQARPSTRLRQTDAKRRPGRRPSFERLESRLALATIDWSTSSVDLNWDNPDNWVGGVVPGPSDDAVVAVPNLQTVVLPQGGIDVDSLTIEDSDELDAPSGTITTTNGLIINIGTFIDGVKIDGPTSLTNVALTLTQSAGPAQFNFTPGVSTISGTVTSGESLLAAGHLDFEPGSSNDGIITGGQAANNLFYLTALSGSTFVNNGTIDGGPTGGTFQLSGSFENRGKMNFGSADGGGTGSWSLVNESGATLNATTGYISSTQLTPLVNDGTMTIGPGTAGSLFITGDFVQGPTGVLDVDLGGTTAGSTYDILHVSAQATLAGTLDISTINGYVPPPGSSFQVMTYANAVGSFTTYDGTNLTNGLVLQPLQFQSILTLAAEPAADLAVSVTSQPTTAYLGGSVTYIAKVTNDGPANAPDAVLTDTLPSGVPQGSITTSAGTYSVAGSTVTADLGPLAVGASATLTIVETPTATGSYTDSATVSGPDSDDTNQSNNSASATATVVPPPSSDLQASITAPSGSTTTGLLSFVVSLKNNGPSPAAAAMVADTFTLPAHATLASESASQGTISVAGGVVTARFGTLADGATATLTVVVAASANVAIADSAVASSTTADPNSANNSGSASVTVKGLASVALATSTLGTIPTRPVTLSATVSAPPGFAPATGTITFYDASTPLGSAKVDASGRASLVVTLPAVGTHHLAAAYSGDPNYPAAVSSAVPVRIVRGLAGDFDGDGKADTAVYDQTTATFLILDSGGGGRIQPLGNPADANIPVAGDFDGDGKTDLAIYDQTTATFLILYSGGRGLIQPLGNPADKNIPVAGDFDGDGKTDLAVYDQITSTFLILYSGGGGLIQPLGNSTHVNVPVAGDFDGDGKTDLAVFDQTAATFFILYSGGGGRIQALGNPGHLNIPVAGDFDGDGKTDVAVYDQTAGVLLALESGGGAFEVPFGNPADVNIPFAGDFDGDGRTDLAIYDATDAEFFVLESGGGSVEQLLGNAKHKNLPV